MIDERSQRGHLRGGSPQTSLLAYSSINAKKHKRTLLAHRMPLIFARALFALISSASRVISHYCRLHHNLLERTMSLKGARLLCGVPFPGCHDSHKSRQFSTEYEHRQPSANTVSELRFRLHSYDKIEVVPRRPSSSEGCFARS